MTTFQLLPRCLVLAAVFITTTSFAADAPKEDELIAVLKSDAAKADKAITCKKLAVYGTAAAVPEVAKLLPDPQLNSWARTALEAIPGSAADEALREATKSLEGLLLVGTINSIGVRRDAKAVELLTAKLADKDPDVASAAAIALGKIGGDGATKSLRGSLAGAAGKLRGAVAEGCILCAERLHTEGKAADAAAIYDEVRKTDDLPKIRVIEATRGAILARNQEGLPLLLEQLAAADVKFFRLGLSTAREFPGNEIDKALAAQLESAKPDRAALIITAMADRPQTVVLPAIVNAAAKGPKPIRLAAIKALGSVGDAASLPALLDAAGDSDVELAAASKEAIAGISGEKVDAEIIAQLPKAQGKTYPFLIALVGQRRIEAAHPELMKAVENSDAAVRQAALKALGETVPLNKLSVLVALATKPKNAADAEPALAALKTAAVRMPDPDACATELTSALAAAPAAAKITLLEILTDVGGAKALQTVAAAAKSKDPEQQDAGSRLLGKWGTVDAAPVLLDLSKTAPEAKYQVRALRGYIGLARKFPMPEPDRVSMLQKAYDGGAVAEKKLVLDVLKVHPSADGLKLAIDALKTPALKDDATQAVLIVAQKVAGQGTDVSKLLAQAGIEKVKIEITKAEYGAGSNFRDVTSILQKQAGDLPLIILQKAKYNDNFGGDPAPGQVKQLKVQYKLNGKAGEAAFAEDAVILLQ